MKGQDDIVPSYEEAMQSSAAHTGMNLSALRSEPASAVPYTNQQPGIVHQVVVNSSPLCRSCRMPLHTRVGHASTCCTHVSFLLCCIFGMFLCAPFLYCTSCCREPRVYCVNCGDRV